MEAGHKATILMIDDERFLLELYKTAFEKEGHVVSTYYDVDATLKALREGANPDVIIFDITMPGGRSGYEFIETIVSEKLAPLAFKVALTNAGQEGAQERVAELGADAYLVKVKYLPAELVTTIEEMLQARA